MKNYYAVKDEHNAPVWMPVFISLMLVLLTIFIFLTTFSESDKTKVRIFKENYRNQLFHTGKSSAGIDAILDSGTGEDPLSRIVNRMKSKGINKNIMDEFLTLKQIKELPVLGGDRGVSIVLPDVVAFEPGVNRLTDKAVEYLESIAYLVSELPNSVEIKGYSSGAHTGAEDALEFSAQRAFLVFDFFVQKNIAAAKMKVSGCGDAFEGSGVAQDKVEIIFKSPEL